MINSSTEALVADLIKWLVTIGIGSYILKLIESKNNKIEELDKRVQKLENLNEFKEKYKVNENK